jgi:hypothetical protein
VQAINKLSQKLTPFRNSNGNTTNKTKDGITNQNILFDKFMTCLTSLVSRYSQTNANNDVNGMEAKAAPQNELRLASSETATNTAADNIIFNAYCNIILFNSITRFDHSTRITSVGLKPKSAALPLRARAALALLRLRISRVSSRSLPPRPTPLMLMLRV